MTYCRCLHRVSSLPDRLIGQLVLLRWRRLLDYTTTERTYARAEASRIVGHGMRAIMNVHELALLAEITAAPGACAVLQLMRLVRDEKIIVDLLLQLLWKHDVVIDCESLLIQLVGRHASIAYRHHVVLLANGWVMHLTLVLTIYAVRTAHTTTKIFVDLRRGRWILILVRSAVYLVL